MTAGTDYSKIYSQNNCTISGNSAVANANPIRYRGYYYDEDTGLYYCNARYYSPKWRRFLDPANNAINPHTVNGLNVYVYADNNPINIMYQPQYVNCQYRGSFSANVTLPQNKGLQNTVRAPFSLPQWVDPISTAIDHAFSVINPIRSAAYTLMHTNLWGLMRLDGVTELPGALSTTATVVGWGLGLVGGVFAGCEKYASGASVISSVFGGLINAGISIGSMYAATGIATWGMRLLAASTALPGGAIILIGAAATILIGIAINHALTEWNIGGDTIEGHLNNFIDWLIFWD